MIKMITNRCWIATLLTSALFVTTVGFNYLSTKDLEQIDLSRIEAAPVENNGPAPDLDNFEQTAPEPLSVAMVSVMEPTYPMTFTSQPIQTGESPQLPQVLPQQPQPTTPIIQKPVPETFQDLNPPPVDRPLGDDIEEDKNLDVLMRGPLHEAYAEVYQYNPKPSVVIDRQPPEPIDELPPEFKPEGENVEWIPGYWAWDDQRDDFIWISGVWRNTPSGQRWVPGYWQTASGGFRWVSGFWISAQQAQVDYVPQPPESLDNGPVYPAPSDDHYYAPGSWVYQNNAYVWQTGYWAPRVAQRVWIPARYIWTPHGCIYRPGFWDFEFDQRGVLFAPVCFNAPVYRQAQYCYQPAYVINTNVNFMAHLFVRPTYCHYYFGDWYGPRYVSQNFYPWANYGYGNLNFRAYDPLFSYYRCRSTRYNNVQALGWVQNQFSFYFQYQNFRPKHTYRGQRQYAHNHGSGHRGNDAIRRASYGERYDEQVNRHRQTTGRTRGYSRVDVDDRIDSLAVSREISRRRSQVNRQDGKGQGQRKQTRLELPKTKYTSVKRATVQLPDAGRNRANGRQENGAIKIPDEVRRKFETHDKLQAEKRQRNRSTQTANPDRDNRSQGQVAGQSKRIRPQESTQLDRQRVSATKQSDREPRSRDKLARDQSQTSRNQQRLDRTGQENAKKRLEVDRQALENRARQKQRVTETSNRRKQSVEATRLEEQRRAANAREKQRAASEQNRKNREGRQQTTKQQTEKVRADQQRAAEKQSRQNLDAQRRVQQQEAQRRKPQRQRDAQQQAQQQREAKRQAQPQRDAKQQAQRQRDTQQQAQRLREAQRQAQQKRDSQQQAQQQREAKQQAQRQREAQQQAQQQRETKRQAQPQRDAKQQAQRQRDTQQQAQRQRNAQRQAQQKRDAQQQAQQQRDAKQQAQRQREAQRQRNAQQQVRPQRDAQQQVQKQRDAQQQAQKQRVAQQQAQKQRAAQQQVQKQRVAQQQAQKQRATQQQAQKQRAAQQQAQKQRAAQQQAQRQRDAQRQAQRQRDSQQQAQRQREAKQRADQQRVQRQRESQQRAEQQRAQRQRESQQRAQRDAQNRAQRDANRQKNNLKRKKNGK